MTLLKTLNGLIGALYLASFCSHALQPPSKEQIAKYQQQNTLQEKITAAKSYGNHQAATHLLNNSQQYIQSQKNTSHAAPSITPWKTGFASSGTQKTFTLLLAFNDMPAPEHQSREVIYNHIHGDGVAERYPNESLTNFYYRSSYGQLTITGDVFDWYTTPYPRDQVVSEAEVIKEALRYHEQQGVDFSQYDNDGDGDVDYFSVIWTGEVGEWATQWWGHQTSLYDPNFTLSGKTFATYSWQWLSWNNATDDFDPQVLIHETGHALGLPDYYDYDLDIGPDNEFPVSDMMRNNLGDHNAFSKFLLGWITPKVVGSGSETVELQPSSTSQDALIIMPELTLEKGLSEYFVVQNRDQKENDSNMYDDGLLIWHIDATQKYNNFEFDNSYTDHHLIRLISADADHYYQPGHSLTSLSTPSSQSYRERKGAVEITSITANESSMSLLASIVNIPQIELTGLSHLEAVNEQNTLVANITSIDPVTKVTFSINGEEMLEDTQAPYQFDFTSSALSQGSVTISAVAYTDNAKGSKSLTALKLPSEPTLIVVNTSNDPEVENTLARFIKPVTSLTDIPVVSPSMSPAMFVIANNSDSLTDEQFERVTSYVNAGGNLYFENTEWYFNKSAINAKWQNLGIQASNTWSQTDAIISGVPGSIMEGLSFSTPVGYFLFNELEPYVNNENTALLWQTSDGGFSNTIAHSFNNTKLIASTGDFSWFPESLRTEVMARYLDYFGLDNALKPMSVIIDSSSDISVIEGTQDIEIMLTRLYDDGTDSAVSIAVESTNAIAGTDYQPLTMNTVAFELGALTASTTVRILDDLSADGDKSLTVLISGDNVSSDLVSDRQVTINITDDESRGLLQFSQANISIGEAEGSVDIKVSRIDGSDDQIDFTIVSNDLTALAATDYAAINEQLTFEAGDTEKTFTMSIIDNAVYAANKTFSITLVSEHLKDNKQVATVTIINDEPAPKPEPPASSSGGTIYGLLALLWLINMRRCKK